MCVLFVVSVFIGHSIVIYSYYDYLVDRHFVLMHTYVKTNNIINGPLLGVTGLIKNCVRYHPLIHAF